MPYKYEQIITDIISKRIHQASTVEKLGRKNPSRWIELRDSEFVLQPDIDMLLCKKNQMNKSAPIHGIELKALYLRQGRYNWSYYDGLDEALALTNYGLDFVTLIQCFIFEITNLDPSQENDRQISALFRYANPMRKIILGHKLPIGYIPCFTFSVNGIIGEAEKVEVLDSKSDQDAFVITPKRIQFDRAKHTIRKIILKKYKIAENRSPSVKPLLR